MALTIANMRDIIWQATASVESDYSKIEVDRALRVACQEFVRRTKVTRANGSKTLTVDNPVVDTSAITGFRPERFISAEVGYDDRGTWATSTSYTKRQLVVGDGTPDAYIYYCVTSHTSSADNEPPNAVWSRVYSRLGDEITGPYSYEHIRDRLTVYGQTGMPEEIAFEDLDTGYVWPVPNLAYPIKIWFYNDLTSWTLGGSDSTTLNIPDEYLDTICWTGAAAVLDEPQPDTLASNPQWRWFLNVYCEEVAGQVKSFMKVGRKRARAYTNTSRVATRREDRVSGYGSYSF